MSIHIETVYCNIFKVILRAYNCKDDSRVKSSKFKNLSPSLDNRHLVQLSIFSLKYRAVKKTLAQYMLKQAFLKLKNSQQLLDDRYGNYPHLVRHLIYSISLGT